MSGGAGNAAQSTYNNIFLKIQYQNLQFIFVSFITVFPCALVCRPQGIIKASVGLIRRTGRAPRFIHFLRQICGTNDRPMPNNQVSPWRVHKCINA